MSMDIRWLAPVAIYAIAPQCITAKYMSVDQARYPNWRDQFVGNTVKSPLRLDEDIANIGGATLSSRHVTDGIKRLLFLHQSILR